MLPFLNDKKITTVVVGPSPAKPEVESDSKAACKACAERLISGIESKDPEKVVSAISDLMVLLDSDSDKEEMGE